MASNIYDELAWRGMIFDGTEGVADMLRNETITVYNGFDPTADSLGAHHLLTMMALARMQRFGHSPIAIAGGGTAMIGDPGGRSTERNLLTMETVEANAAKVKKQLESILDFEVKSNPARVVNNADWLCHISMMDFLRDIGKHFTVNYMVAKDSVKSRLDREGAGISFTEFSYMLLQAYDFLMLHDRFGCRLQLGGSDQWGNITAGTDLIRRMRGAKAHGLVYPLITKADGTKFGKTAGGTIWLDPEKTSPYRFFQFWFNTDDAKVVGYLKSFTWLGQDEIAELAEGVESRPEKRTAQRKLAQEVTRMVHGETALAKAEQAGQVLFGGELTGLDATDIADIFADVPSNEVAKSVLEGDGVPVVDLLADSSLANSKGAAKRDIKGGGIYLNNQRVSDFGQMVSLNNTVEGQFLVLRKGKRKYHLVKVTS